MIAEAPVRAATQVELPFTTADGPLSVLVDAPEGVVLDASADAMLAAGWFPAMARREPLVIDRPASARLVAGAERIADVLLRWDRSLHPDDNWYGRVPLDVEPVAAPDLGGPRGNACFFTAGVDSFHSVLRHRDRIDELVFVHGFDLPADRDEPLNREVSERLRSSAALLGLPLVELSANLVAFGAASGVSWDDYHGAAMATIAHLLATRYSTVLVPATTTYDRLYPLGSHPLLDPLWSSERVEIVHDGADATRVEKLREIAEHPAARRHLRVCTLNTGDAYNCGVCEKCVRTAVGVRIAGVEGRFESLPSPSLRDVAAVEIRGRGHTWHAYADELARSGSSPQLRAAIRLALLRWRLRDHPLSDKVLR